MDLSDPFGLRGATGEHDWLDDLKDLMDVRSEDYENKSLGELERDRANIQAIFARDPWLRSKSKEHLRGLLIGPLTGPERKHARDALAVRIFQHYLDDHGEDFILTLAEMKAMNEKSDLMKSNGIDIRQLNDKPTPNPQFTIACNKARSSGTPQDYTGSTLWGWDNGAISSYYVKYAGTITAWAGVCKWQGAVEYSDRFDMDPRPAWSTSNRQGRTPGGERRTRIGYILNLGTEFDIKSPKVTAWQWEMDERIALDTVA